MASAAHLKALLKAHMEGDDDRFFSVAMQVAAHEARHGHGKLAEELRAMIDDAKSRRGLDSPVPIGRPRGELAMLLEDSYPTARLGDMILGKELSDQIRRVIREQRHAGRILEHGLAPRRKLLLLGPSGTGKTMTASVLAGELGLPLLQVRLDGLITKFMGETAAKLRQVFDAIGRTRGVYFFDEFDAVGSQRGLANDVGEIRRVLNSFLLMIEQDRSHSIVMAATNHPDLLDPALFRRFDDVLHYELPDQSQVARLLKMRLANCTAKATRWAGLGEAGLGLSYAEVTRAADEVLKDALINQRARVRRMDIARTLEERKAICRRLNERVGQ
ncbi:MAG: ATP-binding protein [Alphaproteobacteria bacterium]|nr:ATP-binding protein [Alphaproteobacteria bacterium]